MRAPLPEDEAGRLLALREYRILDTPKELSFDDIAELASVLCGTPIAAVSLIDEHRQWFKAITGLDVRETHRDLSFCAHAILKPDRLFEVPDAMADERFTDNALVLEDPHIRFYAGMPLVDRDGIALGAVCVIDREPRHLTDEQKRALQALARQTASLLQLHRTLQQSERQAEELRVAQKAKDNFFAGIGHELRTPLNGVVGLTDVLMREQLTDRQCETLSTIDRSGRALLRVVNDLIDLSQHENPIEEVRNEPFRPREMAREVADLYLPEAKRKGLVLSLTAECPRTVEGDAHRIHRLLTQIVDNAMKFTESGSIEIHIRKAGEATLRFEVHDTGIGFPETTASSPYVPFDPDSLRGVGGAGIGLEVAAGLLQRIGGRIGGHSRPEGGSTVWFEVPILLVSAPAGEKSAESNFEKAALVGKTALVVDDNPVNVIVTRALLERMGMKVEAAYSGTEALDLCRDGEFDLILMDLQMPKMDGIETSRLLRSRGEMAPIVALTASSVESDRRACHQAGIDGYLIKPITEPELGLELSRIFVDGHAI